MKNNYNYGYNYYGRSNRNRVKNLKMRRRMMALALAASLGFGGFAISKAISSKKANEVRFPTYDEIYTVSDTPQEVEYVSVPDTYEVAEELSYEVPYEEEQVVEETPIEVPVEVMNPYQNGFNRGDSVVATSDVRMRLNTSTDSYKLGVLPKGSVVDRILTDGDWDLIRYNGQLAYVHSDYTRENDIDYYQEYYHVEDYSDIVRTTSKVYFRLGPSKSENDICLLDRDEELVVIGKAYPNNNSNDLWYLVRARGQIGFVKAEYTKSLRGILQSVDPSISDVQVKKVGYLKENTTIYDANRSASGTAEKFQLAQVLQEDGDYALVNIDGKIGYIKKSAIKNVKGTFVVVDISDQRIYLYCDTDIAFEGKCTTGKKNSPTEVGYFTPYGKSYSHNFGPDHNNVEARILWMPFNGGQGLHDAPWESNSKFGDYDYAMKHGSAGCVRLPDDVARFFAENASLSTNVLVKR